MFNWIKQHKLFSAIILTPIIIVFLVFSFLVFIVSSRGYSEKRAQNKIITSSNNIPVYLNAERNIRYYTGSGSFFGSGTADAIYIEYYMENKPEWVSVKRYYENWFSDQGWAPSSSGTAPDWMFYEKDGVNISIQPNRNTEEGWDWKIGIKVK